MSDKPEVEFVDGLIVKKPHDNSPEFIVCNISIKRKDLGNWLRTKTDEWINVDVKISKQGKYYAAVNNWKPSGEQMQELKKAAQDSYNPGGDDDYKMQNQPDFDDDIPFN